MSGKKLIKNAPKWFILAIFRKSEACGQTDRSNLIGQNLLENAKIQKFKCEILSDFQTLWVRFMNNAQKSQSIRALHIQSNNVIELGVYFPLEYIHLGRVGGFLD